MKKLILVLSLLAITACDAKQPSADQVQRHHQEQLSAESNSQVGMPAIVNFQEKRMAKMILELRECEKCGKAKYRRLPKMRSLEELKREC